MSSAPHCGFSGPSATHREPRGKGSFGRGGGEPKMLTRAVAGRLIGASFRADAGANESAEEQAYSPLVTGQR